MDDRSTTVAAVTPDLVQQLVAEQFPRWAHLPIVPVALSGWDNVTFRLGEKLSVRLPSAERYVPQLTKEQRWLPHFASRLPLPIPVPVAMGAPAHGYPWAWSINRWLEGTPASLAAIADMSRFAAALALFLEALQQIDPTDGPPAGSHSFHRGGNLAVYDQETRLAIAALEDRIDAVTAIAVWDAALEARWHGPPVWVHGDVSAPNLLTEGGILSAVIDFGCCAVGDPACDLTIAWTFFEGKSRDVFRAALPIDEATWARGRGWALWKALLTLAAQGEIMRAEAYKAERVIQGVLTEHARSATRT
ncbi:MAG: aminoglycoside phosphotransferase family protein [Anaerolineae bacterium]|nr:aminoglycoside phosphotransferase family protein [Anaerolineae bacterium]